MFTTVLELADQIEQKRITPDQIPQLSRDAVQSELLRRWLRGKQKEKQRQAQTSEVLVPELHALVSR